ncbi:uncharacterized protein VNE69_06222 [Vairimorpha necatrix]|uniref:Uncharacterized protein n=1 Tax=Vairimorpha necatrix TaxID=6039 RepID=A0AAX4JD70_9MICR
MIFILVFLHCTEFNHHENIEIDAEKHESDNFMINNYEPDLQELYKYNVFYSEKKNKKIESSDFDDVESIVLKNDVFLSQKITFDFTKHEIPRYGSNEIIKNVDLEFEKLEELFNFEINTNQNQENDILTNVDTITERSDLLTICKNKIKNFIDQKKLDVDGKSKLYIENKLTKENEKIFIECHTKIVSFSKNYIYRINNRYLPKLSKDIIDLEVSEKIKKVLLEIIILVESFVTVFYKKESIRNYRLITIKTMLRVLRYNIDIMSVFDHIPIFKTIYKIEVDMMLKDYKNDSTKMKVQAFFTSITRNLSSLYKKSTEIIEHYEECIKIINALY